MAFNNYQHLPANSKQTGFGVGPHDFVAYAYGTGGGTSTNNLVQIDYFRGGLQAGGTLIATVVYVYDAADNVVSSERTV